MIMKINPDMMPIMAAAVDKEGVDASKLSEYVQNDLAPAIESLEGVASVNTTGQLEERIEVTMNQDKIDALNKKIAKSIDSQFEDAQKDIDAGKDKVTSGQSGLNSGKDQLTSAINQAMEKQKELLESEKDLKKQQKELQEQKKALEQLQQGLKAFMASDAYTGIVTMLQQNPDAVSQPEVQEKIKQLNAAVKEQFSALSSMDITVNSYEDLTTADAKLGKLLTKVNTGIATIDTAMKGTGRQGFPVIGTGDLKCQCCPVCPSDEHRLRRAGYCCLKSGYGSERSGQCQGQCQGLCGSEQYPDRGHVKGLVCRTEL